MTLHVPYQNDENIAEQIVLNGHVQGVGFRPFVYRLAMTHQLHGWIKNEVGRVVIHVQGTAEAINEFKHTLINDAPPLSKPYLLQANSVELIPQQGFAIQTSEQNSEINIYLPPDYFLCPDCLHELFDKDNRRYRYPFINCTQCGPRYTLIKRLPYDRAHTTMAEFALCPACREEYNNPLDRRFHAEPIACPDCGPQLQFYSAASGLLNNTEQALQQCVDALRSGAIVAVKGIGGYHLMCDARNDESVQRLRQHKPRPHKPLAVMFPISPYHNLADVHAMVKLTHSSARLLLDPMRPIVLMPKQQDCELSAHIAPGLDEIGVLLPYSPLHFLLLRDFAGPLVATSANISGEPVMTNNQQVEQRLAHVVDAFLHHNRPIERPADDSVYRVIYNRPRPIRLGRGVAPLELTLPVKLDTPTLALGGHMKNSIALAWEDRVVISPHIGDLDTPRSLEVFQQVCLDLQQLYQVQAEQLVCDAHPAYASHRWAKQDGRPVFDVFHHHAHASAVAAENPDETSWLMFTWDGTGFGEDGTLWGGESFYGQPGRWQRVASQRPFYLPGGEKAGREPWRAALALCWEAQVDWPAQPANTDLLLRAWQQKLNSPQSTAIGRLFDAAASLTDVCHVASFEGQAPMQLEATAMQATCVTAVDLPLKQDRQRLLRSDWSPLLTMLLDKQRTAADRAACFHYSLARNILMQCNHFRGLNGDFAVGLGGGVFQNRLLSEITFDLLVEAGFRVYLPQQVPCNDGGLCLGQIMEAACRMNQQ